MNKEKSKTGVRAVIGAALFALVVGVGVATMWLRETRVEAPLPSPVVATAPVPPPVVPAPVATAAVDAGVSPEPTLGPTADVFPNFTEKAYPIDLDALRKKLPDNLYWTMGAPTKDPEEAKRRAEAARKSNDLYGKVLSNTGSEEEIRDYFAQRRRISEDYIQFAQTVVADYGDALGDQDLTLLGLSMQMHSTRLAELPREIDEALARKKAQDEKRQAWERAGKPVPR